VARNREAAVRGPLDALQHQDLDDTIVITNDG